MPQEVKTFDQPVKASASFDATMAAFNRHFRDASAGGLPEPLAGIEAAVSTMAEFGHNVADIMKGRRQ